MDCGPPGSSAHGTLQARILEWVAIPFSRGSSWPRDRTALQADSLLSVPPEKHLFNLRSLHVIQWGWHHIPVFLPMAWGSHPPQRPISSAGSRWDLWDLTRHPAPASLGKHLLTFTSPRCVSPPWRTQEPHTLTSESLSSQQDRTPREGGAPSCDGRVSTRFPGQPGCPRT